MDSRDPLFRRDLFDEESAHQIARKLMEIYGGANRSVEQDGASRMISDAYSIAGLSYTPTLQDRQSFGAFHDLDKDGRVSITDLEAICRQVLCDMPLVLVSRPNVGYSTQQTSWPNAASQPQYTTNQVTLGAPRTEILQRPPYQPVTVTRQPRVATPERPGPSYTRLSPLVSPRPVTSPPTHGHTYSADNGETLNKLVQESESTIGKAKTQETLAKAKTIFDGKRGANSFLDPLSMRPVLEEVWRTFRGGQASTDDINKMVKGLPFSKDGKITITEISLLALRLARGEFLN